MRKLAAFLLVMCLLPLCAAAEGPVTFADDLTGVYTYPEGASYEEARYVYTYRYPQLTADRDIAVMINDVYAYAVSDALGFEAPIQGSAVGEGDPQKRVDITYTLTCLTDEHLSFLISKRTVGGSYDRTVITGHVYALTGSSAGRVISLPYYLGLLDEDDTEEWYQTRQTNKADACVRDMVWEKLLEMEQDGLIDLYDDLTFEELEAGFYPEEDFYLNEAGDPVFYLLAGSVAPQEAGDVLVTISLEDLLDEI